MSTDKIDRNNPTEVKAELTEEELAKVSAGRSLSMSYGGLSVEYKAQKSD
jgi:hypothetical protein